jgi:hypothetical protein
MMGAVEEASKAAGTVVYKAQEAEGSNQKLSEKSQNLSTDMVTEEKAALEAVEVVEAETW